MHARALASFWRENLIAVVILLCVLVGMEPSYLSVKSLIILRWREGLTFSNKGKSADFSGGIRDNEVLRSVFF